MKATNNFDRDLGHSSVTKLFLLLVCTILLSFFSQAQNEIFLRIFNKSGLKFSKGFYSGSTDSTISIKKDTKDSAWIVIPYTKIGSIKTKRSFGRSIKTGVLIGGISFGTLAAVGTASSGGGGGEWLVSTHTR